MKKDKEQEYDEDGGKVEVEKEEDGVGRKKRRKG